MLGKFDRRALRGLVLVGQLGLTIALSLIFFVWLGQLAARLWGYPLLFVLIGVLVGLFIGFSQAYRILRASRF